VGESCSGGGLDNSSTVDPASAWTASVTVNWGRPDDTVIALRSLASMSMRPDLIVCVDNGSAPEHVEELRRSAPEGTVLLEMRDNLGVAAANNAGIEYATVRGAEWILLLNNDAIAGPRCLERCISEARASERIAIVGPAVTFADEPDLIWFAGGIVNDWTAFPRHRALRQPTDRLPPTSDTEYVSTCCALISASAWRQIGAFKDEYFMYYDDAEWCQRARAAGWRCRYVGEALCTHAVSASGGRRGSLGLSENMAYYLARNPLRFALDTPNLIRRATRVAGLLSVYLAFNVWRLIQSRQPSIARAYVRGLLDAVRGRMGRR
jgi:GT2 family glycosyltransferase